MAVVLRPYQAEIKNAIYGGWAEGARNMLAILPTGAGKTVTFSDVIRENGGNCCAIAHRQELVTQISMALARDGVHHKIIGPKSVVKLCVNLHMAELGTSYYDANSTTAVAGVDTLTQRAAKLGHWANSVTLWVQDEAHHVVQGNKWGNAAELFPNARGLGVTATPLRADGKGLGSDYDGIFDRMVVGPGMRDLINMRFLTDYRIFAPKSDMILTDADVSSSTGDYKRQAMSNAAKKSHIVGDVVDHYLRIARGKLGVTFATDVELATTIADQFNKAGVPAEVVSAKTPDSERVAVLKRFKNKDLHQLVNVDLFGEGFDLPAIEVVSMARPTQSYGLYVQQFGRALRLMDGKEQAIIIDHVGNVERHGLPDAPRQWSLARREKRAGKTADDVIPVRACPECTGVYERVFPSCPYCGHIVVPAVRSAPKFVDGDLIELDEETLARMRGDVATVDKDPEIYRAELAAKGCPQPGQMAHVKRHAARQEAQASLRESIAWWGGYQRHMGRSDSESYKRFFFKFGIDVLSAQALGTAEAIELNDRISGEIKGVTNGSH